MDDLQFDTLVRAIAAGVTRRSALGILAGLAGFQVADAAAAKRRRKRHRHKSAAKKKDHKKGRRANVSAEKQDHKVGVCHRTGSEKNPLVFIEVDESAVPAHQAHGDAVNVDLQTDPENCGTCGNVCAGDVCNTPVCEAGVCGTTPVNCDDKDACTDDTCDVAQGGCVHTPISCDDSDACTDDSCDPASGCVHTRIDCDDGNVCTEDSCDAASGCVHTDVACPQGETCCPPDTGCVNLQTDRGNCGACGNRCANGTECVAGSCVCVPGGTCQVDDDCCEGESCLGGTCSLVTCQGQVCPFDRCDPVLDCQCYTRTEQNAGFCGDNTPCADIPLCSSSAECSPGSFCAHDTCCGPQGVCITTCGTLPLGVTAAASEEGETTGGH